MQNLICRCDVCGVEKGNANGWFLVEPAPWDFTVVPWEFRSPLLELEESGDSIASGVDHICGYECLHKRLSEWLENISRPTPANSQEAI